MKILVVAATEMEIQPFIAQNERAEILITGVGLPSCMYALTKCMLQNKFDIVIQAGIAGTFKNQYALGETFLVKTDVFADLGIYEKGTIFTLFDKGFAQADKLPYTNGVLMNSNVDNLYLPSVNALTINTVTDDFLYSELLRKKYDADIESMEGAAFHYVCIEENVPFLQIRGISNFVGERVKTNWKIEEAITNLNFHLIKIVNEISNKN